jgi:threonine dehydrogenase-like Zn-dependent dehydrogenase
MPNYRYGENSYQDTSSEIYNIPFGAVMNKGLTIRTGQTHMMRYMKPLLDKIEQGAIDPSFVISHRVPIDRAPEMYRIFRDKQKHCTKVVLDPWSTAANCGSESDATQGPALKLTREAEAANNEL